MSFFTKPRLIGIALVILGVLGYLTQKSNSALIAIAGIILCIAPSKHTHNMLELFLDTLKSWKTIIITALYDSIYWLFVYAIVYFTKWRLEAAVAEAQSQSILSAATAPETAGATAEALRGFAITIFGGAAIVFILSLIAYTLARGIIWNTITDKKSDKKVFLKFLGANAGWWIIWGLLFVIISLTGKNTPATKQSLFVLLSIAVYFTPIMQTIFIKTKAIGYSISNGIAWGIARFHRFIVPYIFALIVLVIMYQPFNLVQNTEYKLPASMLFFVLYFAWLRIYMYGVVKEFDELKKIK